MTGMRAIAASTGWNAWSWYWLIWLIVTIPLAFLIPELIALASGHPENTLSAQIWRLEQFLPGHAGPIWSWTAMHFLIGGLFAVLFVWLIGHFTFGVWT
jgi:hypothetical protein